MAQKILIIINDAACGGKAGEIVRFQREKIGHITPEIEGV
jgi:hypothetical protein